MMGPREIAGFLLRVGVLYCLFQAAWLVLGEPFGVCFRAMVAISLGPGDSRRELSVQEIKTAKGETRVEIVNRSLMAQDGSGPVRHLDFNARSLAWRPSCLLAALILASSIPWRRRLTALGLGLFFQQVVMLVFIGFAVWLESAEIGLVDFSPSQKDLLVALKQVILSHLPLVSPVIIWLLVTFRARDLRILREGC